MNWILYIKLDKSDNKKVKNFGIFSIMFIATECIKINYSKKYIFYYFERMKILKKKHISFSKS